MVRGMVLTVVFVCLFAGMSGAQKSARPGEIVSPRVYKPLVTEDSPELQTILNTAVGNTINKFRTPKVMSQEVAATLIDLSDSEHLKMAQFRGIQPIYPASVVKMFYMVGLERQLEDKKVTMTTELARGLRDMIVDSSNEATQYIFDVITGTASGAEMPSREFKAWQHKRNRVNRYFASMGYEGINVNQKTFCEDAYGIEQQSRNYKGENRNMLTTNATARLLAEIVLRRVAGTDRTRQMMELMKREPFAETKDQDDQAHGFIGRALIDKGVKDAKIWSKAGWTSKARHDAAYIETADGRKFVLVIFTENHAGEKTLLPMIAGMILDNLRKN